MRIYCFSFQLFLHSLLLFSISAHASLSSTSLSENCSHLHKKIGFILPDSNKNNNHCKIKQVILLSRAWYSNLRNGDKIIAVNQQKLNPDKPCQDLKKQLQQLQIKQQTITLELMSESAVHSVVIPGASPGFMNNQRFITSKTEPLTNKLSQLQIQLQDEWLDTHATTQLYQSIACLTAESPATVLPAVIAIQKKPLELASAIELIKQQILPSETTKNNFSLADFLINIQSLTYTIPHKKQKIAPISADCNTNKLFDQLEQFISSSHQLSKAAFADINNQDTIFFINHYQQLTNTISQSHSILNEPNKAILENINQLFEIAARVNYAKLSEAAGHWFQLADANWLDSLKTCLSQLPSPDILQRETPFGKIILGTHNDDIYNIYPIDDHIALLIDPAGNDFYKAQQNTNSPKKLHLYNSAIIDLAGNDQYDTTTASGFAFAVLANTLLVDAAGNDRYTAKKWAQGSAFAGIAALYDSRGNDHYSAESFSQASGLFGSGLLVDSEGDDTYSIKHHGQALGLPYGHGVLMDNNGNDHYTMRNGLTSSYTNKQKTSESWGQGCGKGFRHILPGGLGILIDTQGNDSFSADEFAQGGGYYYGMGLLYNLGNGDDHYQGSHYNVGFSAHQAIGGLSEAGGNDFYQTTGPAFCGTAWDQSISLFYDHSGNDTYASKDFSLAASAHNSIASFWDISGEDKFNTDIKPAFITGNQYHVGQSLSYFFSADKNIPQRININKQEFVLTGPVSHWQLTIPSLLKSVRDQKSHNTKP